MKRCDPSVDSAKDAHAHYLAAYEDAHSELPPPPFCFLTILLLLPHRTDSKAWLPSIFSEGHMGNEGKDMAVTPAFRFHHLTNSFLCCLNVLISECHLSGYWNLDIFIFIFLP